MGILLEAPVFTLEAALKAAEYGVNRLELCADFGEGGTTPSVGTFDFLKSELSIPIFVMIRPRGGDFIYSKEELKVMENDIRFLRNLGADGFVFGALDEVGQVNQDACQKLIYAAEGLPCTFHRAFDITVEKRLALESIIDCGFSRILTSGGENTVTLGMQNIKNFMTWAGNRIIIMPGGGSRPDHVLELKLLGNLKEVHASCKTFRLSKSRYNHPSVCLSTDQEAFNNVLTIDRYQVQEFLKVL
ncbi:copper homeostasis protein CutC [Mongoliibacter ruber]|uniref:PF03932 family protein CutC n=1 Tax=Mongoliibacter ruber TaxID=1750599 RepID=A0A2T0WN61_9BACT|nr:copper homeostasis protein CutC [Mongoliibacter ruber]PRY88137.1 copper homeostasis protein [Mongoliibacter ruber]